MTRAGVPATSQHPCAPENAGRRRAQRGEVAIEFALVAGAAGCGSAPELKDGDRILVTVTQDFDFITAPIPGGGFDVAASDELSIHTGVPR